MSRQPRDRTEYSHRWDLEQIFATPEDWDDAADALREECDSIADHWDGPVTAPAELRAVLDDIADLYRRNQRLALYALLADSVSDDPAAADRMRRSRELERAVETAAAAAVGAIEAADDATLDRLAADLDERAAYFESLRRRTGERRASGDGAVVERLEERSGAPDRIVEAVLNVDFDPPIVERPDGERATITHANFRAELSRPDRDYRRRVYEAYLNELGCFEGTLARAYGEKLSAAADLAETRGYDSVRDSQLRETGYPDTGAPAALPVDVHDALIESVADTLGPRERARRHRAEALGVETLRPWDCSVPTVDAEQPEIPYEDAVEHVLDAVAPLGEDYRGRLREFLAGDRVDVHPREGKRGDVPAFCPSSAADGPFVLLNYQGDVRSLFYLCHELGHAMHVDHHREEPAMYATSPRPVEEVPSVLHELLLIDHCLGEGGALADHARARLIECVEGNFYGAAARAAFKRDLAARVEDGETLDAERIGDAYAAVRERFDPLVERGERARPEWLTGALARDAFHHYQYVLGVTGALAVHERLREGDLDPATYRKFLRSTGRSDPVALFDRLGVDVTATAAYERAAARFDDYLDQF